MTIDEMIARKKELGYSYEQLSKLSGVPVGTVQKLLGKITKAPRRSTILALEKVLEKKNTAYDPDSAEILSYFADGATQYDAIKGTGYTLDDYYALPDEKRVELIDGVFFDMAAPSSVHQLIQMRLWALIDQCIQKGNCPCKVLAAPFDVQLDRDNKTMVQPDVLIICNQERIRRWGFYGEPDYVAEILSPSTRGKDMLLKLNKYLKAGVREYWVIDPDNLTVIVYDLEHELKLKTYGFDEKVPLLISGGKCEIDFNIIYEEVKPFLEAED